MPAPLIELRACDPLSPDALALLQLAADEARELYPEFVATGAPLPTNAPLPPRGIYLVAYVAQQPVGMGAHYPLDGQATELRRMYVLAAFRQQGVARQLVHALEQHATQSGFTSLRLETGFRQLAARRLYESCGFTRIPPFGRYQDDPTSICFEKSLGGAV